jgi:hypothetical protein
MKNIECTTCNQKYDPTCNYRQGRCPHHPPLIEGLKMKIQPKDTSKGHFYVSLTKSGIRIVAGVCLVSGNFVFAGIGFILAEVLGIVEEMV